MLSMVEGQLQNYASEHWILLVCVSIAFVLTLSVMAMLCGWCDCFQKGDKEQKVPILSAEAGNPLSQPSKPIHLGRPPPTLGRKTIKSSSLSDAESNLRALEVMESRMLASNGRSCSLDQSFERPDRKMMVEQVQPDARKLRSQVSLASLRETLGLVWDMIGLPSWDEEEEDQVDSTGIPANEQTSKQSTSIANNPSSMEDGAVGLGVEENLGQIQFSIHYEFTEQTLVIRVLRAKGLPAKDFSGTSDPFVKILLLPNKKHKVETKVKRKNLNPVWNETFLFEGFPYSKLQDRVLHLEVLDYDRFSRNDAIGETNLPLQEVDLTQETMYWRPLVPSKKGPGKLGKILLSLCYAPTSGRITIVIMKCENLAPKDITGKSDPYVKIWQICKDKRIEKKKTCIKYATLNPVYNESFMFAVSLEKIRDMCFYISVNQPRSLIEERHHRRNLTGAKVVTNRDGPLERDVEQA
ncbi:synaptotagmin-7-like [Amphiura filiformis]|uniref:synaptotagmin-7-like n=1 Tax=Amphiura filiformis TaxID=82378 RepID=UPI003B211E59